MGNSKNTCSLAILTHMIIFFTVINRSSSARRTLDNPAPTRHRHRDHQTITFLMRSVLNTTSSSRPATTKVIGNQIPFPKPLGIFPPNRGVPLTQANNPWNPVPGSSTATLNPDNFVGFSFPAFAALQELELGSITGIDEYLFESLDFGTKPVLGKARGVYVASSDDGISHMMAMTAYFAGSEFKDGLRFFGVHRKDVSESHISVIGGTGVYDGANGYASIKFLDDDRVSIRGEDPRESTYLLFTVYLS